MITYVKDKYQQCVYLNILNHLLIIEHNYQAFNSNPSNAYQVTEYAKQMSMSRYTLIAVLLYNITN